MPQNSQCLALAMFGTGYCSQSTFCSVSPCPHVFLRRVGSLNLSPHLWENFPPNFGKTPNFSPISVTNSSPKLVNPQICPQILGQIRPQIWWIPKLVPNFRDKFVPKFGDSPNLSSNLGKIFSPNLVNPQICPQISGQIRPQIWGIPKFVPKFRDKFVPKFVPKKLGNIPPLLCSFSSWVLSEVVGVGIVSKKDKIPKENFLTDSVFWGEKNKL